MPATEEQPWPVTALDDIRFTPVRIAREGYDMLEVDQFLDSLRAEFIRLFKIETMYLKLVNDLSLSIDHTIEGVHHVTTDQRHPDSP